MDERPSMYDLAADDVVAVVVGPDDPRREFGGARTVIVARVVLPSKDASGGVFSTRGEWVPAALVVRKL